MKCVRSAALIFALTTAACGYTTAQFQPYETRGDTATVEGRGGARKTVAGVDIWTQGTPPRRFQILGVVELNGYQDYGDPEAVLAEEVRKHGGHAAIPQSSSSSFAGVIPTRYYAAAVSTTKATYLVVRYLD